MSGGRAAGPRSLAARTTASNSAAMGAGMLPSQARSISWTRMVSSARFPRSNFECFVMLRRVRVFAPERALAPHATLAASGRAAWAGVGGYPVAMSKGRLEAFSDGVLAIIITIMVLELHPPEGASLEDLAPVAPAALAYLLSFVLLGIYWNNHHHLLQASRIVNGRVLWANLHLLFWLSLFPFATAWLGEHPGEPVPVAAYGVALLAAAIAYDLLARALIAAPGQAATLATAMGTDAKGKISPFLYAIAVPLAFVSPAISIGLYVIVALLWVIPDRRIERHITS